MSETKKGPRKPYGTAIFWLGVARQGLTEAGQREIASAIRVLTEYPKWEKLIEAAKDVYAQWGSKEWLPSYLDIVRTEKAIKDYEEAK